MTNIKLIKIIPGKDILPENYTGAVFYDNGYSGDNFISFYVNGLLHSEDDMPACLYNNGAKRWYKHGVLHRENGHAIELYNSENKLLAKLYFINGEQIKNVTPESFKLLVNLQKLKGIL